MINKKTVNFLEQLEQNNNREWFQAHKDWYEESRKDFNDFVTEVRNHLLKADEIEKSKVYRIYRDLRFSPDKTPYKTHFAAHFTRKGKYRRGGFYLHISPSEVFVGGGFWNPDKDDVQFIRKGIQSDPESLRKVLAEEEVLHRFGTLSGDELKTAPKGVDRDHPDIDLLRKKQFTLTRNYPANKITAKDFDREVAADFIAMIPVFQVFTDYLLYDNNGIERNLDF